MANNINATRPSYYLYKNANLNVKSGRALRAKVWWKIDFPIETNMAYKNLFESLEKVLVHGDRFNVSNEALITIFQRNYLYIDAEDVIYFINSVKEVNGNLSGMKFDYRIM